MVGWIIGLTLLFILVLLFFLPIRVSFRYAGENTGGSMGSGAEVFLHILLLKFQLYPKRKKINIKDFDIKKLRKKGLKLKKHTKGAAGKTKKVQKRYRKDKKRDLKGSVRLGKALVQALAGKLCKYLKIRIKFAEIRIAARDAAETAVLYGWIIQAAAGICALLTQYFRVSDGDCRNVRIVADYTSAKGSVACALEAQLRVWQLLSILVSAGLVFVRQPAEGDSEEKKARERAARAEMVRELNS